MVLDFQGIVHLPHLYRKQLDVITTAHLGSAYIFERHHFRRFGTGTSFPKQLSGTNGDVPESCSNLQQSWIFPFF